MLIEIKNTLYKKIESYCTLNELNVIDYINKLINDNFLIDLYGEKPDICNDIENKDLQQEEKEKSVNQPFLDLVKNIEGDNLRIIMEIGREYSEKNKDPNEYIEEIKQEYTKRLKKETKKQLKHETSDNIEDENGIVEELYKLSGEEVSKTINPMILDTLNKYNEETKQEQSSNLIIETNNNLELGTTVKKRKLKTK
jgi:hypothetical protein